MRAPLRNFSENLPPMSTNKAMQFQWEPSTDFSPLTLILSPYEVRSCTISNLFCSLLYCKAVYDIRLVVSKTQRFYSPKDEVKENLVLRFTCETKVRKKNKRFDGFVITKCGDKLVANILLEHSNVSEHLNYSSFNPPH